MRLDDDFDSDYEYGHNKLNMSTVIIMISLFILLALSIVVVVNKNKPKKSVQQPVTQEEPVETQEEQTDAYGMPSTSALLGDKLSPDDLEFWDIYSGKEKKKADADTASIEEKKKAEEETGEKNKEEEEPLLDDDGNPIDPMDDGRHTKVTLRDGKTEWVVINSYLNKNTFDFTKLVSSDSLMKYVEDGKTKSFVGVDISRYQGNVDFYRLKDSGVDYCMIRVGGRGYATGVISPDEYYETNITNANNAGMPVGLYFYSQAVTTDEAIEEANYCLLCIGEHKVSYPIAFDMEFVENDTARIEGVTKADKTAIAKAFMDTIAAAGYRPMLYGNKEWLIKEVDLTKLNDYEIWLSQCQDMPDYPYRFSMWQYTTSGQVNGIDGYANLDLCFIDYSAK